MIVILTTPRILPLVADRSIRIVGLIRVLMMLDMDTRERITLRSFLAAVTAVMRYIEA